MPRANDDGRLLRERSSSHHNRVTYVELFFDLVFVFAITQISHTLLVILMIVAAWEAISLGSESRRSENNG